MNHLFYQYFGLILSFLLCLMNVIFSKQLNNKFNYFQRQKKLYLEGYVTAMLPLLVLMRLIYIKSYELLQIKSYLI